MKNKLFALIFAIGLILIGGIVYSPQSSSQAIAEQRTEIIPVGPGVGKKGRVQQIDKGIAVQFECQSQSTYSSYNIFLDKNNVGQLRENTGSRSGTISLEKSENLFTFIDDISEQEVDKVMLKVQ